MRANRFFIFVSQLTDQIAAVMYCPVMRQVDFYFHDGCLSQQSILMLAREIQQDSPAWQITLHPLLRNEAEKLDFHVLPAIVMNGDILATGIPRKDWLLAKLREWERGKR